MKVVHIFKARTTMNPQRVYTFCGVTVDAPNATENVADATCKSCKARKSVEPMPQKVARLELALKNVKQSLPGIIEKLEGGESAEGVALLKGLHAQL